MEPELKEVNEEVNDDDITQFKIIFSQYLAGISKFCSINELLLNFILAIGDNFIEDDKKPKPMMKIKGKEEITLSKQYENILSTFMPKLVDNCNIFSRSHYVNALYDPRDLFFKDLDLYFLATLTFEFHIKFLKNLGVKSFKRRKNDDLPLWIHDLRYFEQYIIRKADIKQKRFKLPKEAPKDMELVYNIKRKTLIVTDAKRMSQ